MRKYLTFFILFVSLFAKAQEQENGACFGLSYSGNDFYRKIYYNDIISEYGYKFQDSLYWRSFNLKKCINGYYIEKLDSSHIKMEGEIKNGERNGLWKFYKTSENTVNSSYCVANFSKNKKQGEFIMYIISNNDTTYYNKGFYENDKLNGVFLRYEKIGNKWVKIFEVNFLNGSINGKYIRYFENGNILSDENYVNNKKQGESLTYFENKKLESKGNYYNDTIDGTLIRYNFNGDTNSYIVSDQRTRMKTEIYYFYNGKKRYIIHYLNGYKNGQHIHYYMNGNIESVKNYTYGKNDGEFIEYYYNGTVKAVSRYANGAQEGWEIKFSEKGDTLYKAFYVNDNIEGQKATYTEKGKLESIASYKNDLQNGPDIEYSSKKVLLFFNKRYNSSIENYKDDKLDGDCKYYNSKRRLIREVIFKNDIPYTSVSAFDFNGNKLDQGTLVNGNGTFKAYFRKGKLFYFLTFKNAECNGEFKVYDSDGEVEQSGIIYNITDTLNTSDFKRDYYIRESRIFNNVRKTYPYGDISMTYDKSESNWYSYGCINLYNDNGKGRTLKREIKYDTHTKTSLIKEYNSDAHMYSSEEKSNDSLKFTQYYDNGIVKLKGLCFNKQSGHYTQENKEGDWFYYYSDGKMKSAEKYKENKLINARYYDVMGELKRTLCVLNDSCSYSIFNGDTINQKKNWLKHGKWIGLPFNSGGSGCNDDPNTIEYYNNGKPCGIWLYSNNKNELLSKYSWNDSAFSYCYQYDPSTGKIISEGKIYKLKDKFGLWKFYDIETGKLKVEGNFYNDEPKDQWKEYNDDRSVKISFVVDNYKVILKKKKLLKKIVIDQLNYINDRKHYSKRKLHRTIKQNNEDNLKHNNYSFGYDSFVF